MAATQVHPVAEPYINDILIVESCNCEGFYTNKFKQTYTAVEWSKTMQPFSLASSKYLKHSLHTLI